MKLLQGWRERIDTIEIKPPTPKTIHRVPRSAFHYAGQITFVDSPPAAADMLQLAQERPLSHIGIDSEFRYSRPGVPIDKDHVAHDPRNVLPLLVSLAMVEPADDGDRIYRFVVDVRMPEVLEAVGMLLRLPVTFAGHFLRAELHTLWQLGMVEPDMLWDTWVAEKCLHLGLHNRHYRLPAGSDEVDETRVKRDGDADEQLRLDLASTCTRHGVTLAMAAQKQSLQRSFLEHADDQPFTPDQIAYAAADAVAAAELYPLQVHAATRGGLLKHLLDVEMPWVTVNARMIWHGVRLDRELCQQVSRSCHDRLPMLVQQLQKMGLASCNSHPQLVRFFGELGLLHAFQRGGKHTFDKDQLKSCRHLHPAVELIHQIRKVQSLQSDKILWPGLTGADGRVHPDHRHLGADSGRQSSRWPNVLGLDRTLRPLVVPEPGFGIGEVDLCQIEVGIAASVYGDDHLIDMFNSGDVYSEMAKLYYRDDLPEEDHDLAGRQFKQKYAKYRDTMKTCTLGIIYGVTPFGLAIQLNTTEASASQLQKQFLKMFPALSEALAQITTTSAVRGYAETSTGLRRHRGRSGRVTNWESNWLRNHPVQGTAADLFKRAGIRLDRLYQQYQAKLIIPFHDAYVFEAPLEHLEAVADLTARVMCEAVQEAFPQLRPRAEINNENPHCWNKGGQADALEKWLAEGKSPVIDREEVVPEAELCLV
jgi:DNA polymerase I